MNAYLRAPFDFCVQEFWLQAQGVPKRVLDCSKQERLNPWYSESRCY